MHKNQNYILSQIHTAYAAGQFEKAIDLCEEVLCEEPANVEALTIAGSCSVAMDRAIKAEIYFKRAAEASPENGELHFMLGNAFLGQQKIADALMCYTKAEKLGCRDEVRQKIYYLVGLINQVQGQTDAALINYKKSEETVGFNPDQTDILLKRIQIYVERGDLANAEEYAARLKLLAPETFNSYQLLFQILLQQKKSDEASGVLDEAERCCSGDSQVAIEIGFDRALVACFRAEENPDRMKEFYNSAISQLNRLAKHRNISKEVQCEVDVTLSEIYLKLENIRKAMEYSARVINRTDAEEETLVQYIEKARFILLECHMSLREYEKALQFARVLKNAQNTFYRHHGYYSEALATKQLSSQNMFSEKQVAELYGRAIDYYKLCTVQSPVDLMAYVYRIKAYADVGRYEEAYRLSEVLTEDSRSRLQEYIQSCKKSADVNAV